MTTVIVGMLIALLIAGVVVALVAVPARREGREILTAQGGQIIQTARERTVEAVGTARDKVGDLADRLPARSAGDESEAPVEPTSAEPVTAAVDSAAVDSAPVDSAPVDSAPVDSAAVDSAAVDSASPDVDLRSNTPSSHRA